jgi:glycosyltransferase involved in cell wall biosynthesis
LRGAGVRVTAFAAHGALDLPRVVKRLVRLVREHRIDTVFSLLVHANAVAACASWFAGGGVRFIQSVQTTQARPRWHWWVQRFAQHYAECVVVPSPSAGRVAHEWADVPREKVVVIPNAIDPAEYRGTDLLPGSSRVSSRAHALKTGATFRIGFIGRLDPVKRIPDLLAAVASLEDRFQLHVFGDGADRAHLSSIADRFGISERVTFHGVVAQPQFALARIDLLVLPSEAEGFGLVLIEAMAAGVPVVATEVAGICDVVKNGVTGLLVPVASPAALAGAIRRVAEDEALRRALVQNARADVCRRFTWDVVLPQYAALLLPRTGVEVEGRRPLETLS